MNKAPKLPKKYPKLCYKVVWDVWDHPRHKLVSCCQNDVFPEQFRLTYRPGEITFPSIPGSRLFVFKNEETARAWIGHTRGLVRVQLWSCEVYGRPIETEAAGMLNSTWDILRFVLSTNGTWKDWIAQLKEKHESWHFQNPRVKFHTVPALTLKEKLGQWRYY